VHDSFFVDDDIGAFSKSSFLIPHAEGLHHFPIPIAQERVLDLREVDKGLLGEDRIGADAQNLGILCRELSVIVVRTGRLQLLDSGGAKVEDVKINEDIFPPQAAELEFSALGAV